MESAYYGRAGEWLMSIELKNITYTYSPGTAYEIHALKDINLEIPDGQFIGADRSYRKWKIHTDPASECSNPARHPVQFSTMGRMFGQKNTTGGALRSQVGLVFQYPEHQLFESDVLSDVCFGPMNQGMSREEAEAEAKKALLQVGFKEKNFSKSPFELSGGQKKELPLQEFLP